MPLWLPAVHPFASQSFMQQVQWGFHSWVVLLLPVSEIFKLEWPKSHLPGWKWHAFPWLFCSLNDFSHPQLRQYFWTLRSFYCYYGDNLFFRRSPATLFLYGMIDLKKPEYFPYKANSFARDLDYSLLDTPAYDLLNQVTKFLTGLLKK